jgi:hypothetical protein
MEHERSLLSLQELATCLYPEPNQSIPPPSLSISSYQFYIAYVFQINLFNYEAFWTIRKMLVLRWGVVGPSPHAQAGGPHLFRCPRLLLQYTRSCRPYLVDVFSIRNLRTRHTVVTKTHSSEKTFVQLLKIRGAKVGHDMYGRCSYGTWLLECVGFWERFISGQKM